MPRHWHILFLWFILLWYFVYWSSGYLCVYSFLLQKGHDHGMFRELNEILFVEGYPGYQYLLSMAKDSMELICEVKGEKWCIFFPSFFKRDGYHYHYWELHLINFFVIYFKIPRQTFCKNDFFVYIPRLISCYFSGQIVSTVSSIPVLSLHVASSLLRRETPFGLCTEFVQSSHWCIKSPSRGKWCSHILLPLVPNIFRRLMSH